MTIHTLFRFSGLDGDFIIPESVNGGACVDQISLANIAKTHWIQSRLTVSLRRLNIGVTRLGSTGYSAFCSFLEPDEYAAKDAALRCPDLGEVILYDGVSGLSNPRSAFALE